MNTDKSAERYFRPSAIVFSMQRTLRFLLSILLIATAVFAKDKYQRPGPIHPTRGGEKWAEKTLHKLTLEEKVGQVFMIWCRASFLNVENPEYLQLREAMQKYHVGSFAMTVHVDGPYLMRSEPYEAAELLNRLQRDSKLPLLFAADFERGVAMRLMEPLYFRMPWLSVEMAKWKTPRLSAASPPKSRAPSAFIGTSFPTRM